MFKKEVKELEFDKEVLKRIEMICRFTNTKPIIQNGSIINIKGSNIAYVSPHIITIKKNNYLISLKKILEKERLKKWKMKLVVKRKLQVFIFV